MIPKSRNTRPWNDDAEIIKAFNSLDKKTMMPFYMHRIKGKEFINEGIYILAYKGSPVYVGESKNIFSRLGSHVKDKTFDSYRVIPCSDEKRRKRWEKNLIYRYNPPFNYQQARHPLRHYLGTVPSFIHNEGGSYIKPEHGTSGTFDSKSDEMLMYNPNFISNWAKMGATVSVKEAIEIEHEILKDEEATRKWKNLTTLRLMYMSTGCSLDLKINYDIEEERKKIPYKEAKKIFGKEGYRTAYELA